MAKGKAPATGKYEGSPKDMANDRREARKRGMTLRAWEGSAADRKMDAKGQKALAKRSGRGK